jgi:hypothetical protein
MTPRDRSRLQTWALVAAIVVVGALFVYRYWLAPAGAQ